MGSLWSLLTSNLPQSILMLVGTGLLVFEMVIPGFGVPGILGIITLGAGFLLLGATLEQGLLLAVIVAAVLCVALVICLMTANKGRLEKSRLALRDVALSPDAAGENDLNRFLGRTGQAHTDLRPSGIGVFDGEKLNVVSDGEFIAKGAAIRVRSVAGNRVVVKEDKEV